MDIQTIDQQYSQLQNASQQVEQELKELATKLQAESTDGNQQAREWVLDLKEIALAIQSQQQQTMNLLQAIHGFVANQNQAYGQGYAPPMQSGYPQPGYVRGAHLWPRSRPAGWEGFCNLDLVAPWKWAWDLALAMT